MTDKILITDAYSPVGKAIFSVFEQTAHTVLAPEIDSFDWDDSESLKAFLKDNQVDVVINTAGWQETPDVGHQLLLVSAAKCLAKAVAETDCVVIHLSSYRVFGGENKSSYDELDKPLPLGPAGRAFLEAERAFERDLDKYICLRMSWVLDIVGESVFRRLLQDLVVDGPRLEVTHQRRGSPISTTEIGRVVLAMVNQILCGADNWGVFHLSSGDPCSSAEFAEAVADILEREGALKRDWGVESLSEEALALQGEPDSAALTVRRCRDNFGYQIRSWRQGLTGLIRHWLETQKAISS
ncbi:MAG: SDR family oxidoreductase [Cellvibrionaceae bacterium]